MKALILGFFSTLGDLDCLEIITRHIKEIGGEYTIAPYGQRVRESIPGSRAPEQVNPEEYTHVIVLCGPFWDSLKINQQLLNSEACKDCVKIGINLSMIEPADNLGPFDYLIERDSLTSSRPDLTFLKKPELLPTVGVCLVHEQKEYGADRCLHNGVEIYVARLLSRIKNYTVFIDTRLPVLNQHGFTDIRQIETAISRVDILITTRLHGLVYAIKNLVPVIAIDPIKGGAKVTAQAECIDWPYRIKAEELDDELLFDMYTKCLSENAVNLTKTSYKLALDKLGNLNNLLYMLDPKYNH